MRYLMILVLIGLVGQTMGYKEFNLKRSEKLELKDLLRALGDRLGKFYGTKYEHSLDPEAHMVADLLAETKDKQTEIFNGLTIDQLLTLNEWTADNCTDIQLEERHKTCLQLCTREDIYKTDKIIFDAPRPLNGRELVPYNLGRYCWFLLEQVLRRCPGAQARDATRQFGSWFSKDAWTLSNFNYLVKKHIADHKIPVHELAANREANYREAVEDVYAEVTEKSYREEFKRLCQVVVVKLGNILRYKEVGKDLRDYHNLCKVINDIQEKDN